MINYTQLKAEIETGPLAAALAPFVADSNHDEVAKRLNDPTQGGTNLDRQRVDAATLQSAVVPVEFLTLDMQKIGLWHSILIAATGVGVPIADPQIRQQIFTVFTATGAGSTRSKMQALQSRPASRGEELFGEGTLITPYDVAKALRS